MEPIGMYMYVYGAGNSPNRKIEFSGDGQKIQGKVSALTQGEWEYVCDIDQSHMIKEGASTTEKMKIMMEARKLSKRPEYPSNSKFSELRYKDCQNIIKNLDPTGNYRISIVNRIDENPRFEIIERLNFFDPS